MISFVVLFGKTHIDIFFDTCLPSLITGNNIPSIKGEAVNLLIATINSDAPYVHKKLDIFRDSLKCFSRVKVIASKVYNSEIIDSTKVASVIYHLMSKCINICYKSRQSFLFIAADQIFLDGTIGTNWDLHKVTGKIVATLNFRIKYKGQAFKIKDFSKRNLKKILFKNFAFPLYYSVEEFESDVSKCLMVDYGFAIVSGEHILIFSETPNPMIGKIQLEDLLFFAKQERYNAWDSTWIQYLYTTNRLFVQTNGDIALTIEPEPEAELAWKEDRSATSRANTLKKLQRHFGDVLDEPAMTDLMQRYSGAHPRGQSFCFSIRIDGAMD